MKKKVFFALLAALLLIIVVIWPRQESIANSVSVVFLYYTNMDDRGWNDRYTWAWFRLENHSPFVISFSQGPLDIERHGKWTKDTNRIRYPFGPTLNSGKSKIVSLMPPEGAAKWRTSYFITRMSTPTPQYVKNKNRFRNFMDKIGLHRFGMRAGAWNDENPPPEIVTSKTIPL